MRVRPEKQREGIVSLTQTEIMLVLTVVILLLLLLKNDALALKEKDLEETVEKLALKEEELNKVCDEVPATCENILVVQAEDSTSGSEQPPIDKDQEITGDLVQSDGSQSTESKSVLEEEQKTKQEDAEAKKKQLQESQKEKLEELQKEAAVLREKLEEKAAQTENLQNQNKQLRDENVALKEKASSANAGKAKSSAESEKRRKLRDEVGFIPCWLNNKGQGPRYYSTFDLTYRQGKIKAKPHRHWKWSNASVVQNALSGGLKVLNDYPRNEVSREQFLAFAKRVQTAKNKIYGTECELAVTINGDVRVNFTSNFIRAKAGFYPVAR